MTPSPTAVGDPNRPWRPRDARIQSKAQLYQDAWASWASGCKTDGFFVEFGAASGVREGLFNLLTARGFRRQWAALSRFSGAAVPQHVPVEVS